MFENFELLKFLLFALSMIVLGLTFLLLFGLEKGKV
jgi:hypothetical protein